MPKKRNHQFKPLVTNLSRPASPKDSSGSTRTVNERLAQLRAEQAPRPTIEQRNEIATLATSHTLPPHLRRILDVPETAPPLPKPGARRAMRINGVRMPPGPPAPRSWLAASLHAPPDVKTKAKSGMRDRLATRYKPDVPPKLVLEAPNLLPNPGSLIDCTLRVMAMEWEFISVYEQLNLATLPARWKSALLSYLSIYGPDDGIRISSLRTLFLDENELNGATGSEEVACFDLSGLITASFTIADLEKFLYKKPKLVKESTLAAETLDIESQPLSDNINDELAESWEDAASMADVPNTGLKLKSFPNLARLSLAHAGSFASWSQLLSLTAHLHTLTHLSLAYWPLPTTTPNLKSAFITHNHASIPVSGTHFYSRLDDDWAEAASILKRLSKNTYRLQHLDLEGCSEWIPALTWTNADGQGRNDRWVDRTFRPSRSNTASHSSFDEPEFAESKEGPGPNWNGSWASLTYVNIAQGMIPRDVAAVRSIPAGVIAAELLLWLRGEENTDEDDVIRSKGIDVRQWLQREKEGRAVESTVRALRASAGGKYCKFDHGWEPPKGAVAAVFKTKKVDV
ncbi:uncharacterized protein PV09_04383 [Verruconis gallopava]|uniref:Tafazzin n=1 Tax=Verruconis gallopava TaxID=253628 RepID=A0A0D1YVC9_9PEZI|nr:uncharacterized protein PV09_04383 [Verruconis gallopava]KIW04637.1 hypothetical protein PV09_04383 [Verruconis gallopava]